MDTSNNVSRNNAGATMSADHYWEVPRRLAPCHVLQAYNVTRQRDAATWLGRHTATYFRRPVWVCDTDVTEDTSKHSPTALLTHCFLTHFRYGTTCAEIKLAESHVSATQACNVKKCQPCASIRKSHRGLSVCDSTCHMTASYIYGHLVSFTFLYRVYICT